MFSDAEALNHDRAASRRRPSASSTPFCHRIQRTAAIVEKRNRQGGLGAVIRRRLDFSHKKSSGRLLIIERNYSDHLAYETHENQSTLRFHS
ncbi:MAG: hypothetical protein ACREH8_03275, partial [Opitutaceae bacterium]